MVLDIKQLTRLQIIRYCEKLEQENKKLKEYNWELIENHKKDIAILCEENNKLKSERDNCLKEVKLCYNDIHSLELQISDLEQEDKTLTECNLNLQTFLDNKEKVNKSLREENKKLKEKLEK